MVGGIGDDSNNSSNGGNNSNNGGNGSGSGNGNGNGNGNGQHGLELLPRSVQDIDAVEPHDGLEKEAALETDRRRDKIRCLDGLRGVACFLVFNYHFLWPWTPIIMLGFGARPPHAGGPYGGWLQLPIICLTHRGRPMVAIFFAISGYVVCRHILRSIHQKKMEAAYKALGSAVFRRIFRLYIPASLSMLLVAVLAQVGLFKSNEAIYTGPDSVYINGTTAFFGLVNEVASNESVYQKMPPHDKADDLAYYDRYSYYCGPVHSPLECLPPWAVKPVYSVDVSGHDRANAGGTSDLQLRVNKSLTLPVHYAEHGQLHINAPVNATGPAEHAAQMTYARYGGMWEEHPWIHDNFSSAVENFTRIYAEWANPFTFNPVHTRYDPHTYTMPMELRGSVVLYTFLLGTATAKATWRLLAATVLAMLALYIGRWEVATFVGGMALSEIDVLRTSHADDVALSDRFFTQPRAAFLDPPQTKRGRLLHGLATLLSLYLLSYPDSNAKYTPGFNILSRLTPRSYSATAAWEFYHAIGALGLLPCILRSASARRLLETRVPQYLGRISFAFYLMHGPLLHSLGFWMMPRLLERLGRVQAFALGYVVSLALSLWLAGLWYRKVDVWTLTVGRRIEKSVAKVY